MKKLWDIFYHRKKERQGLTIMLLLIIAALFFRYLYLNFYIPEVDQKYADQLSSIDWIENDASEDNLAKKYTKQQKRNESSQRFTFDPNTISADSLTLLGIPSYVGKNLEKYRAKGGKFRKPADFAKLYGMEKHFDKLKDLIVINKPKSKTTTPTKRKKPKVSQAQKDSVYAARRAERKAQWEREEEANRKVVELNTADSTELLFLKGVGPFFAKTILEYREKLGGYVNAKQLIEAYGTPDTILRTIGSHYIRLDLTKVRKINLNTADFKTLIRHPYINKSKTNAILNYRKVHGQYKSIEDIKKIHLIDDDDFKRLRLYLEV